jgi:hypothetical protein
MNMSIRPLPIDTIELIESKFKIDPVFTEKDWYTQHILGVIAKADLTIREPKSSPKQLKPPQQSL